MSEIGTAQWRGSEIEARQYYYFYKSLNETLTQERAQLKELEGITSPALLKFGVGTRFGNAMGEDFPMKPVHLIELAKDQARLDHLMAIIVFDDRKTLDGKPNPTYGEPHPTHPDGMPLIAPKLKKFYLKNAVMTFRAFGGNTIHKWMMPPEDKVEETKGGLLAKLLGTTSDEPTDS